MASRISDPEHHYIAYIDEAGDPGLTKVRPKDPSGASEWLTLGAIVVKARVEPKLVSWVRDIRYDIKETQGPDLHFRKLSDHRKQRVCELASTLPIRGFAVLSHKPNMKQYRNEAAEAFPGPRGWFYNWCVRLLLERITDACEQASIREFGEPKRVKLVFSQRGGVKYNWLQAYIHLLMIQSREERTYLRKREIKHRVLDPRLIEVIPGKHSAGCQLADVITSAFHNAADALGPRWNTLPAEKLKPCMTREAGFYSDYGVTLLPTPWWRAGEKLTSEQKNIFEVYDHDFRR